MLFIFLYCVLFPDIREKLTQYCIIHVRQSVSLIFQNKIQFLTAQESHSAVACFTYSYISFRSDTDSFHSLFTFCPLCVPQKYEQELFKLALPCLSAVAGALPPDYMESNYVNMMEKQASMDSDGNFNPQPVDTSK